MVKNICFSIYVFHRPHSPSASPSDRIAPFLWHLGRNHPAQFHEVGDVAPGAGPGLAWDPQESRSQNCGNRKFQTRNPGTGTGTMKFLQSMGFINPYIPRTGTGTMKHRKWDCSAIVMGLIEGSMIYQLVQDFATIHSSWEKPSNSMRGLWRFSSKPCLIIRKRMQKVRKGSICHC